MRTCRMAPQTRRRRNHRHARRHGRPGRGGIGRARLGQNRARENLQGAGRSQRGTGPECVTRRSLPTMATCLPSTICPPYPPDSPMHSAGWRAAAASRSASSIPTRTKCCSRRPVQPSSTARSLLFARRSGVLRHFVCAHIYAGRIPEALHYEMKARNVMPADTAGPNIGLTQSIRAHFSRQGLRTNKGAGERRLPFASVNSK